MSSLTGSDDMNHEEKFIPDITLTCGYPDEGASNPPAVPIAPLAVGSNTVSNLALLVEAILKDEKWKSYVRSELTKDNSQDTLDLEKVNTGSSAPEFEPEAPLSSADAAGGQEVMNTYEMADDTSARAFMAPASPILHAMEPGACSAPMSQQVSISASCCHATSELDRWQWVNLGNDYLGWGESADGPLYTPWTPPDKTSVSASGDNQNVVSEANSKNLFREPPTAWNEAYIMLVSCIDYALDMTCIQSVSQRFIVGGIL